MMRYQKLGIFIVFFLIVAAGFLAAEIFVYDTSRVRVAFLDVGQGDAILISRGSNQILIDTGRNGKTLLAKLGVHMPFWDRTIEAVVLTHPDQDHIGGFPVITDQYRIGTLFTTNATNDTATWRAIESVVDRHHIRRLEAFQGDTLLLGDSVILKTLFPLEHVDPHIRETNAASIVQELLIGNDSFLFTGDLPSQEESLVSVGPIRILKAGHHGSKYSTSNAFLDRLHPEDVILSVGKNSYGHPSPETLKRLADHHVQILRTDELGDIVYECFLGESSCVRENAF